MREIKFRAWICDPANLIVGEMGDAGVLDGEVYFRGSGETSFDCIADQNKADGEGIYLMQYTGLKDKNCREIYEGDLLKIDYSRFVRRVLWYAFAWGVAPAGDNHFSANLNTFLSKEIEVIGNIYENPELLEVK